MNIESALNDQTQSEFNIPNIVENLEINNLTQSQLENNLEIEKLKKEIQELKQLNAKTSALKCHICERNHKTTQCWYFPQSNSVQNGVNGEFQTNNFGFQQRGQNFYRRNMGNNFRRFGSNRGVQINRSNFVIRRPGSNRSNNFKPYFKNTKSNKNLNE